MTFLRSLLYSWACLATIGCGNAAPEVQPDPETTPWLFPEPQMELLDADDVRVRGLAVKNLGKMGARAEPAIPQLEKLREDPDENIRALAEKALADIRADLDE